MSKQDKQDSDDKEAIVPIKRIRLDENVSSATTTNTQIIDLENTEKTATLGIKDNDHAKPSIGSFAEKVDRTESETLDQWSSRTICQIDANKKDKLEQITSSDSLEGAVYHTTKTELTSRPNKLTQHATGVTAPSIEANTAMCDQCLLFENIKASHLCFDCEKYLCATCSDYHIAQNHNVLNSANKGQMNVYDKVLTQFQNETDRSSLLKDINICGWINTRDDERDYSPPEITGMCVLQNEEMGVLVDHKNHCLKLFNRYTSIIVRYIRFDSAYRPWGVIALPQTHNISMNVENTQMNTIAVTFPRVKEISIISLDTRPASIIRAHEVFDDCFDIVFFKEQYVALCYRKGSYYLYFLHVSGITGKHIKLYRNQDRPLTAEKVYFAMHPKLNMIYVSSSEDRMVMCYDYEGNILPSCLLEYTEIPAGICIDQEQNLVLCSNVLGSPFVSQFTGDLSKRKNWVYLREHGVYLREHGVYLREQGVYTERLFCHKDKLYITFRNEVYGTFVVCEFQVN